MERIQFDKDVKPISEFRANAPSLIEQVHRTKRPLVITQHGKSAAILLDVQEYEAILEKLDVLTDISEAEEDIKKKRFYSSEKALEKGQEENWQVKIFWTEKAIERISEIAQYIAQDSHMAAERWAEKIIQKVESLSAFPKSGRKVPEINKKEYRELVFGNYRIIYKMSGETLYVLTVRHFKQILPIEEIK